jgi:hypothetical protein
MAFLVPFPDLERYRSASPLRSGHLQFFHQSAAVSLLSPFSFDAHVFSEEDFLVEHLPGLTGFQL